MSASGPERVSQLVDLGRFEEARRQALALLTEDPESPALHGVHAQALLGLKDWPGALAAGNRVVGLLPDNEWGHRICSIALDRMGNATGATAAAAAAVRLAPNLWVSHQRYALAAMDVPGRLDEARVAASRAVELAPNEAGAHFTVGVVAQKRRELDVARAAYERALALDPGHALAQHNLTLVRGGFRLARIAHGLGHALRLAPQDEQLLPSVDQLTVRFIRRIHVASLLALVVGLFVSQSPGGGLTDSHVTPVSIAIGLGLALGTAGYVWSLLRSVPRGIRHYMLRRLRSDRDLIFVEALALAMFAAALMVCLVPGGSLVGLLTLRILGLANVFVVVGLFIRRS